MLVQAKYRLRMRSGATKRRALPSLRESAGRDGVKTRRSRNENATSYPLATLFATLHALIDTALTEGCMSTPTVREQFLVISALGANPMELTNVLCRASHENRCAVVASRLTRHGGCSALVLQISGTWDALARLETGLPGLAKKHDFTVNVVRSAALENRPQALPYVAYVSSAYRSDIVNELCQFFIDHNV
eukprot:gene6281-7999_t